MRHSPVTAADPVPLVAPLPGWIATGAMDALEVAAFRSGAALAHLGQAAAQGQVPMGLWRGRMALAAAESSVAMTGRREGQGALRDALYLTGPGGDPGPAGRVLGQWSRAVARPMSVANLAWALDGIAAEQIALCLDATGPTPVDRAARVLEAVLADTPRAEVAALILADAALSKALGDTHLLPLLGVRLTARDLRQRGDDLRMACHRAVVAAVGQALPLAGELARAQARLRAVAPKLRAKAAGRAVDLFLSQDALPPGALTFMSDRAARRLCDRLVALGALRELTGRTTFRLYGV